jgi:hypothetical protein
MPALRTSDHGSADVSGPADVMQYGIELIPQGDHRAPFFAGPIGHHPKVAWTHPNSIGASNGLYFTTPLRIFREDQLGLYSQYRALEF